MENKEKESDKEKYSTISIQDEEDDEEVDSSSFFSKTIEIPKIFFTKPNKKKVKADYFSKAVRYNTSPEEGLSTLQVEERTNHNLLNKQTKALSKSVWKILSDNIFTFFNILLLSLGAVFIAIGDYKDCLFLVICVVNTLIGIIQELRAKQIVDKLSLINASEVKVIRDGVRMKIPTDKIALDDVFFLTSGLEVPCDAFIIKDSIEVNESMLTGESLPVKKKVGDYVLAGSYVVSGSCACRCDRIGEHNYVAQLQNKARKVKKAKSILLQSLNRIIHTISIVIIPIGICLVIKYYTPNSNEYIRATGAAVITMIPSGLFLLISTSLAVSVVSLGKNHTMVQDSYAIESLARTNVLCLDKTGTLTDGTMNLEKEIKISKTKLDIPTVMGSFLGAFSDNNVTSLALNKAYPANEEYSIKAILPFSSARKYSAVQFEKIGTFILGAPEFITKDSIVLKQAEVYSSQGLRVLLLAQTSEKISDNGVFENVNPCALFVLSDHIRNEAYDTIKWFNENEVAIKIISGDNPLTVSQIAKKVGVINSEKYISLEGLTNEEVAKAANEYVVFGRVSPEQKAILIKSLKTMGKTVAMTGDGVNDILAMKQANCSIAMASGSEAARNSAHIVLMDSNFANMPLIIGEGRKVVNNIQRSASLFLMKTIYSFFVNLLEILLWMIPGIGFSVLSYFQPADYYILEFFVIGFPAFFLALQPNKSLIKGNFIHNVLAKALPGGIALLFAVITVRMGAQIPALKLNDDETIKLVTTLALSITGFGILFEICLPPNKYRFFVFGSMFAIAIAYSFLLLFRLSDYTTITSFAYLKWQNWVLIGIILIFAMGLYGLVEYFHNKSLNKDMRE